MKKKIYKRILISITILIVLTVAGAFAFDLFYSSASYNSEDIRMTKIENSKQYKDGKFMNKHPWKQPSFTEYFGTMWEFLFGGSERSPKEQLPRQNVDLSKFYTEGNNILNVTWLGHSSLMINIDGKKILTDPVYETRISVFGPTRFNGDIPLDLTKLRDIDIVLITHNHYDHLNKFSIKLLKDIAKIFIVPLGVGAELEGWGVASDKIFEMDWWDEIRIMDLEIAAAPTQHFSGRGLTDRDKTLWASYAVKSENHNIYFSGDSGYFDGFKKIGDKYGPFDMTFLECGAYNEKWHHIHMYPEETVQAHIDLKGNILHPIHWGTFNLSLHPWYEPMNRLAKAANLANIKITTPVVGATTEYPQLQDNRWWKNKEKITTNNK